jgi:hypothetical protein
VTTVRTDVARDLRRSPLADVRALDLRAPDRDLWADEQALFDRMTATWVGLDDAAWRLPGAAPSDAGGPDWSLADHVGHLVAWQELALAYVRTAIDTGRWPTDEDYDGGDFDTFNERLREPWSTLPRDEILARLAASRPALLAIDHRLAPEVIRGDEAWWWVYLTIHGHYLDHLGIIEAWTATLRDRQIDGDPFVDDPRAVDHADFRAQAAPIEADFAAILAMIPEDRFTTAEVTPGWTAQQHVGHLADWAVECARAVEVYRRRGHWLSDPEEGIDAWNERMVDAARGESAADTLARYAASRDAVFGAIDTLSVDELRSPDGWSWAYDCYHGHIRKHAALLGSWAVAATWPGSGR